MYQLHESNVLTLSCRTLGKFLTFKFTLKSRQGNPIDHDRMSNLVEEDCDLLLPDDHPLEHVPPHGLDVRALHPLAQPLEGHSHMTFELGEGDKK